MVADTSLTKPPPPTDDTLAEAIVKVGEGMERLKKSGLNQKAIVVLLNDCTGVGKRDIERVLMGLRDLAKVYTIPKVK